MDSFRIHGDNIVECERIIKLILHTVKPKYTASSLVSPSTICVRIKGSFSERAIDWSFHLLPGYNKNTKRRWNGNIFDSLRAAGSIFDETPDAIISSVNDTDHTEKILLAIEFCSALQAGNQAWQRSARAFSTGRTGCPYLYVVDFVKYELESKSRARKSLRFPNAAVPYSYVSYSKNTGNFVAQLYTKSEEFDKTADPAISDFDESNFGEPELGAYLVKLLLGMDTFREEEAILAKNMNIVEFLANHSNRHKNYTSREWQDIHALVKKDTIDYAVEKKRFAFHKTIAAKSRHGQSDAFVRLVCQKSVGFASEDLPFGIIPAQERSAFSRELLSLYPSADKAVITAIGNADKHLIIAIMKGFKPQGEDNRPDRGILPLAAMLSASDADVMTYLYGPMVEKNLILLDNDPLELAKRNGLWRSVLALSNFVVLDAPVLAVKNYDVQRIYDTTRIKDKFSKSGCSKSIQPSPLFPCTPVNYGEDDVDTGIHYLFAHILGKHCFEGMCNPPGGDWSGFSVIEGDCENRWLSLPRESNVIDGKRPDHIFELFGVFKKPLLLSIESKERSSDLEAGVGTKLITYVERLMDYVPSVKRKIYPKPGAWKRGDKKISFSDFEAISAAAYLLKYSEAPSVVFEKNCELLFVMSPILTAEKAGWEIGIVPFTPRGLKLKKFIINSYLATGDTQYQLK